MRVPTSRTDRWRPRGRFVFDDVMWLLQMAALGLASSHLSLAGANTVSEDQSRLLTNVFTSNEKDVRPICGDTNTPVQLQVGVAIRQIIDMDEPKQQLYLNIWMRMLWNNCNLQWNASDYNNIENLVVPYARVWVPDITLYDNAGDELEGLKDYLVNVHSDGTCYYNFPSVIKVLCRIDVTYFPFDTQRCNLKFGSWAHHGLDINTTQMSDQGDIDQFVSNSEWSMEEAPIVTNVILYNCCPEPYPDVTVTVVMKRKPLFYMLNLLFPCTLITAVALLGFMLPPDSGEKISLEITVLLSLAVFLLVVSETLPASSEDFPYMGVYFAVAMLLVSLSTLLTVVVLNFHYKGHLSRPVPKWLRRIAFDYIGRALLLHFDSSSVHPESKAKNDHMGALNESFQTEAYINGYQEVPHKQRHNSYSNLSNGSVTTVTNGSGVSRPHTGITICPEDPLRPLPGVAMSSEVHRRPHTEATVGAEVPRRPHTAAPCPGVQPEGLPKKAVMPPVLRSLLEVLKKQLEVMKKDELRIDGKVRHDHLLSDWKKVAAVMDRFFLVIFLVISFISTFAILYKLKQ